MSSVLFHTPTETAYCSLQCAENTDIQDDKFLYLKPEEIADRMKDCEVYCTMCQKPIVLDQEAVQ